MRTKDIIIGETYQVEGWRFKGKAVVTDIKASRFSQQPTIVVQQETSGGKVREDLLAPRAVLQPWNDRLEAQWQQQQQDARERRQLASDLEEVLGEGSSVSAPTGDWVRITMSRTSARDLIERLSP